MGFMVHVLQFLLNHVGINLGRRNVRVTQHLLNRPKVRAVFQQMGRKGVAQGVGCDFLFYLRLFLIVLELFLEQPQCVDAKGYRDRAMLELLYAQHRGFADSRRRISATQHCGQCWL